MRLKPYAVIEYGCTEPVGRMSARLATDGPDGQERLLGRTRTSAPASLQGPAIYIVHHQNLRGPMTSMAWFNQPMRPWVLSVFCERKACFRQFYDYTLTQRLHYPPAVAAAIAWPVSFLVPLLMRSMRALPVYRDPRETIKTFRLSLAALRDGENLLISPDVDYADSSERVGELYEGFLNLEKHYRRETGLHLPFVPLHIDVQSRRILAGQTIYLRDDIPFKEARAEASHTLRCAMQDMEQACEA